MTIYNYIVLVSVAVVFICCTAATVKRKKNGKNNCGCNCDGCTLKCENRKKDSKEKEEK